MSGSRLLPNAIGRIVPATGAIATFTIPVGCTPAPVVLAKDKNVWFVCLTTSPTLGSITPSGSISTYSVGGTFNFNETEQFCSLGPNGDPWCASRNDSNIFDLDTTKHTVTTYTPPLGSGVSPDALAAGPDCNVWIDTVGGAIDVLVTSRLKVTPKSLKFAGTGTKQTLTVSENGGQFVDGDFEQYLRRDGRSRKAENSVQCDVRGGREMQDHYRRCCRQQRCDKC